MGCTCRAAPLRLFINGLAQVHRLETATASSYPFLSSPSSPSIITSSRRIITTSSVRAFHHSRLFYQDAIAPSESPKNGDDSVQESKATTSPQRAAKASAQDKPAASTRKPTRTKAKTPYSSTGAYRQKPEKRFKPMPGGKRSDSTESGFAETQMRTRRNQDKQADGTKRVKAQGQEEEETTLKKKIEDWKIQKAALKEKFPDGWMPRKRLSPDALAGIRALNAQFPDVYTTNALAEKFEVSPENIRRILKSKWRPSVEEEEERQERWHRRGKHTWERKAALGIKPPKKWRDEGVAREPEYHARREHGIQRQREEDEAEKER